MKRGLSTMNLFYINFVKCNVFLHYYWNSLPAKTHPIRQLTPYLQYGFSSSGRGRFHQEAISFLTFQFHISQSEIRNPKSEYLTLCALRFALGAMLQGRATSLGMPHRLGSQE